MPLYGPTYAGKVAKTHKPVTKAASAKAKAASTRKSKAGCNDAGRRLVGCRGVQKTRSMTKRCAKAGTNLITCRWH